MESVEQDLEYQLISNYSVKAEVNSDDIYEANSSLLTNFKDIWNPEVQHATIDDDGKICSNEEIFTSNDEMPSILGLELSKEFISSFEAIEHSKDLNDIQPNFEDSIEVVLISPTKSSNSSQKNVNDVKHACPYCAKRFTHEYDMIVHTRNHSWKKLHSCKVCAVSFTTKKALASHQDLHVDAPFLCDICGRKFFYQVQYTRHQKVHRFKF